MKLVPVSEELIVPFKNDRYICIHEAKDVFDYIHPDFRKKQMVSESRNSNSGIIIDEIICRIYEIVPDKGKDITLYEIWGLINKTEHFIFSQREIVQFCRYYKGLLLGKKTTLFNFGQDFNGCRSGFTAIVNYSGFHSKETLHRDKKLEIYPESLAELGIMRNSDNLQIVVILKGKTIEKEK